MRVFVAVFPPPEVRRALIRTARDLPPDAFRLTAPERVHLTLKFLGEVGPEDVPNVASALGRIPRHAGPFDAGISGLGAFPSARRARILWAGVGEGAEELEALARTVETLLEPQGFPREDRPFVPHLTLGRARRPTHLDLTSTNTPPLPVRRVHLVESRQTNQGVTYETIAEYPLL